MGIQVLEAPKGQRQILDQNAAEFNLPPEFDRKKWAAYWVEDGPKVQEVAQREWLNGAQNVTADGWEVWKDQNKKPRKVVSGKRTYVLCCRLKSVQDSVNAIYGNVGKLRAMAEKREGPADAKRDPGILGDDRLQRIMGQSEIDHEGEVVLNKVDDVQRVEASAIEGREPADAETT
jgi:hypothetical protein